MFLQNCSLEFTFLWTFSKAVNYFTFEKANINIYSNIYYTQTKCEIWMTVTRVCKSSPKSIISTNCQLSKLHKMSRIKTTSNTHEKQRKKNPVKAKTKLSLQEENDKHHGITDSTSMRSSFSVRKYSSPYMPNSWAFGRVQELTIRLLFIELRNLCREQRIERFQNENVHETHWNLPFVNKYSE